MKRKSFPERSRRGWKESDGIPGWGKTKGRFDKFLKQYEDN
jgi:hypothetical protein